MAISAVFADKMGWLDLIVDFGEQHL